MPLNIVLNSSTMKKKKGKSEGVWKRKKQPEACRGPEGYGAQAQPFFKGDFREGSCTFGRGAFLSDLGRLGTEFAYS